MQSRMACGSSGAGRQGPAALHAGAKLAAATGGVALAATGFCQQAVQEVGRQTGQGRRNHHFLQIFGRWAVCWGLILARWICRRRVLLGLLIGRLVGIFL